MSIRDFTNSNGDVVFNSLVCNSFTCPNINGGSGGGGGGATISNSDGSITVTYLNGGANCVLSGAGQTWFLTPSTQPVLMQNNPIRDAGYIRMGNYGQNTNTPLFLYQCSQSSAFTGTGLYITDGNPIDNTGNKGNIYDTHFNPPTLNGILAAGGSAGNQSITDLSSLSVGNLTATNINGCTNINTTNLDVTAITGVSTINGSAYPPNSSSIVGYVSLSKAFAQQIPLSTTTVLTFSTTGDSLNFSTFGSSTVISSGTVIFGGLTSQILVQLNCSVAWNEVQTNSQRTVAIVKNSTIVALSSEFTTSTFYPSQVISAVVLVNSGDQINLQVSHSDSGSSPTQIISNNTFMSITRLA